MILCILNLLFILLYIDSFAVTVLTLINYAFPYFIRRNSVLYRVLFCDLKTGNEIFPRKLQLISSLLVCLTYSVLIVYISLLEV